MKLELPSTLIALALCGAWGSAQATETAFHNDMDGDGRSDLIWRNDSTGTIVYWSGARRALAKIVSVANLSSNSFDPRRVRPLFAISDTWNFPERTMLVVRDSVTGYDYGLYPTGNPNFDLAFGTFGPGTDATAAGDFNGDQAADVFYRDPDNGQNYIVLSTAYWGGWFVPEEYLYVAVPTVSLAWKIAGIGDFDADGHSDILWRHASTGRNAIWRSGNVATPLAIAAVTNLDWKIAAVGDFNGDGRSDILWRNSRTGANVIWKSGSSLTPQAVRGVTNLAWKVVATGDFDGDGKWDLAWRNFATGANTIWKSASAATPQTLPAVTALTWSVVM